MAIIGSLGEIDLGALDASISDTAVDIFVYDTRKDSDGGAWRKRTQHTSWYNETLNTATRGSRREFPAVAVIISTTSKVTIYDGDDPDLPMWMVFEDNVSDMINTHNVNPSSFTLSAKNGNVLIGCYNANYGEANVINFISDNGVSYYSAHSGDYRGSISQRNDGLSQTINSNYGTLVNSVVNDVAMTVLPNAPIDDATGLPIPTIAVATGGGVSVIKDDGSVVDVTAQSGGIYNDTAWIDITKNNHLIFEQDSANRAVFCIPIPSADRITATNDGSITDKVVMKYYSSGTHIPYPCYFGAGIYDGISLGEGDNQALVGGNGELTILHPNFDDPEQGKVAYATTSYNTGWMHGDIKGAFLSDTDATNVTGTELVTNGTFSNTNASSVSNWDNVSVGTGTISEGSGYASLNRVDGNNSGRIGQGMNLVTGKVYTVSFDLVSGSTSGVQLRQYNSSTQDISTVIVSFLIADGVGKKSQTFTSQSGYDGLMLIAIDDTSTVARVDNFSVRIADLDRSVNNKGLQVFGTINKSIVATGAELVAYSNWSTSNYLSQPYNPDLDVGTGDFSIAVWIRATSFDSYNTVFAQWRENQTSTEQFSLETVGSVLRFYVIKNGTYAYAGGNTTLSTNVWYHIVVKRIGGVIYMYVNAKQESTTLDYSGDLTARTDPTTVGVLWSATGQSGGATGPWKGYISLLRFSASAPSAEQIKKIYEDEKVLFQENAACTLHGSSDAVTALAYDDSTNLLYAGTSSGRSDFQGLRRINNTTTAVTTAISASNGLVAEQ